MSSQKWWRWPENIHPGYVPWFIILRRAVFWPFFAIGVSATVVTIFLMYGARSAKDFWRSL